MDSKRPNKEIQIGSRSIKIWFDSERDLWMVKVKEWKGDHWVRVTEAECKKETVAREFFKQEIKAAKIVLAYQEGKVQIEEAV